jgi:hypothetical protein
MTNGVSLWGAVPLKSIGFASSRCEPDLEDGIGGTLVSTVRLTREMAAQSGSWERWYERGGAGSFEGCEAFSSAGLERRHEVRPACV